MEFPRQESWSGLSFPSLGDLPDPGIEHTPPVSPALPAESLPTEPRGVTSYKSPNVSQPWFLLSHQDMVHGAVASPAYSKGSMSAAVVPSFSPLWGVESLTY